jgi:hypothetical protein
LTVPLLVNYEIIDREKQKLIVELGGTINYMVNSKSISQLTNLNGKVERKANNYSFPSNDIGFGGQFGVYYQRNLGEKYYVKTGPQFHYFFTSIVDGGGFNHYPYKTSMSLSFGF